MSTAPLQIPNIDLRAELEHAANELDLAENALLCSSFHNAASRAKAAARRARLALIAASQPANPLPEEAPLDHPPSSLDRRETAAWYHGHACGWQLARSMLARRGQP